VLVGDNSFYPQEIRVTLGSTAEWDYNGGGGETESIHNIVASKELLLRRPEPGSPTKMYSRSETTLIETVLQAY